MVEPDGPAGLATAPRGRWRAAALGQWFERVDPGTHRRVKGLRLVTAYGIAAMMGRLPDIATRLPDSAALSALAGGFALWASVSEARATRADSSRDLALLALAAALGAASYVWLAPLLTGFGHVGPEATLVTGAILVGALRRFGVTGAGFGSQVYIGQLLAFGAGLTPADLPTIVVAALIAALGSIVPRLLTGPAEHPALGAAGAPPLHPALLPAELVMGLQAGVAACVVVGIAQFVPLQQSAWAITASTYIVANSATGTIDRARRRIIGTAIGVPLGIACLPLAWHAPILIWSAAGLAMMIYAMALPERYDIACGAYAFTLVVLLAAGGERSVAMLSARLWETLLGAALGLAAATLIFPLRTVAVRG